MEDHLPSPGQSRYHEARLHRQQQGLSAFLVAWAEGVPVGSGEILWQGCAAQEVHEQYPDCPELNGLTVSPERQSLGIGTALVRAAETLARQRGHRQVGLGVNHTNHRAAALYRRLNYTETGCHYLDRYDYIDDHGVRHEVADPASFLVKQLPGNVS